MTSEDSKNKVKHIRSLQDVPYFWTIVVAVFSVVGFAIYSTAVGNPFIWDDFTLVTNNKAIQGWGGFFQLFKGNVVEQSSFYRPLQMFSYLLDYQIWSLNPRGFHLTSIALHIATAISFGWLVSLLVKDRWIAVLAGLLFLVHPVHNEAVVYISGRADPLMALFAILSAALYVRFDQRGQKADAVGAIILLFLALLSKEYALILPFLLLGYHYVFRSSIKGRVLYPMLTLAAGYFILRMLNVVGVADMHVKTQTILLQRLPATFYAMFEYLRLLILPYDLYLGYGQKLFAWSHPKVIAGAFIYVALWSAAVGSRKRYPIVSFGLMWYLIGLLPVMNLYPINAYMAEHWIYVPSMGLFLVAAYGIRRLYERVPVKDPVILGASVFILIMSLLTLKQNFTWKDPIAFYERIVEINPRFVKAYNNLGKLYSAQEDYARAAEYFRKTFEIQPRFEKGYHNYAVCLAKLNRVDEALKYYNQALSINPNFAPTYNNLGALYLDLGEYDKAEQYVNKALSIKEDIPKAYYNLGIIEQKRGNQERSAAYFAKALQLDPGYVSAQNNLGAVLSKTGRHENALRQYLQAVEKDPNNFTALNNIGIIYGQMGDIEKSIQYFAKALGVKSDFADAHFNIAFAFARKRSFGQAMRHYQDAIRHDPEHLQAINNLAIIYAGQGNFAGAEQLFEQVLKLDGSDESTHNNLGLILAKQRRFDEALEHYQKVLELNPQHKEVHNNIAMLYDQLGRMKDAEQHYIKALELDPEFTNALNGLGIVYGKAKRYQEAEQMFLKALDINPEGQDARNNLNRARRLMQQQDI